MNIKKLNIRPDISSEKNLSGKYSQLNELFSELSKKELNQNVEQFINRKVDNLNSSTLHGYHLIKLIKQTQTEILKKIKKEHSIVPKNHYMTICMLFGISGIGLPIGVAFGLTVGNIGLLALGLPVGMGIGIAIGMSLDKKAFIEGKQLDIEIKN